MTDTVVITGANRGLGLELARTYRAAGANVIGGVRQPAAAAELLATGAEAVALDTGEEASIQTFAAAVGDRPVDVLINNAGIDARNLGAADGDRDIFALTGEHFLGEMRVNAVGPMLLTRAVLPNLQAAAAAKVVNVSSQIGSMVVSATMGRDVGYAASKAALNMITVKQAWQLREMGITVIALHPGYLRTEMGAANAPTGADEAAASIVALIAGLTLEQSGSFRKADGTEHIW